MKPCDTESPKATRLDLKSKILLALALPNGAIFIAFVALSALGLIRPFKVPTGAMSPAINPGDHLMMERVTYETRRPHRGDLLVFSTVGITGLPQDQFYIKRVAGLPGDHLEFSNGDLYVNDR